MGKCETDFEDDNYFIHTNPISTRAMYMYMYGHAQISLVHMKSYRAGMSRIKQVARRIYIWLFGFSFCGYKVS